jgi:hypothetical protein
MNRSEAGRSNGPEAVRGAVEADIAVVRNDASHESIEMSQLRVLCIGMAGMIAADALILICFWTV